MNVSKPNDYAVRSFLKDFNLKLENSVMIGDKIDTDIEMAKRAKMDSVLVMTGETHENSLNDIALLGE